MASVATGSEGMSSPIADWYYVGYYGQLGPLTLEQMEELVRDGVIEQDTFVWRAGLADWQRADARAEFASFFASIAPLSPPPPPIPVRGAQPAPPRYAPLGSANFEGWVPVHAMPKSDRSRLVAGILQLIVPGTGRMYLGYGAQGVLQLFLTPCGMGIGWIWSVIDGIVILSGGVKLDGYGRRLDD